MSMNIISRRRALQLLGGTLLSGAAGQLLSSTRARLAQQTAGPGFDDFAAVSGALTARPQVEPMLALALYRALHQTNPGLDQGLAALRTVLTGSAALGADGKTGFADGQQDLQALTQSVLQAWYLGVAGKGKAAVCVAFVETLANRAVAAELVAPSYSYGPCGSWQSRP